jgi:hypothetical protein
MTTTSHASQFTAREYQKVARAYQLHAKRKTGEIIPYLQALRFVIKETHFWFRNNFESTPAEVIEWVIYAYDAETHASEME